MCCPLDQLNGRLIIQAIAFEENEAAETILRVKGIYDRSPQTRIDRFSLFFQRIELLEKIAEIADECFHLFGPLLQRYTNLMVYQTLRNLHHGAHDIEHVLHSFCFLGDITRLLTSNFFEYQDKERTKFNYLRSLARVCHAVAHFFSTLDFLHDLQLCSLGRFEKVVKYASVISMTGYALWVISLVWQRHQGIANDKFASDMSIHLGGFLFEAAHLTKTIPYFTPYTSLLNKTAAIAGIVHASFVVQRLMPKDIETVEAAFILPDPEIKDDDDDDHDHSPHAHHHSHLHWQNVISPGLRRG